MRRTTLIILTILALGILAPGQAAIAEPQPTLHLEEAGKTYTVELGAFSDCSAYLNATKTFMLGMPKIHWDAHIGCPQAFRVVTMNSVAYGVVGAHPGSPGAGLGYTSTWGDLFFPATRGCFTISAVATEGAGGILRRTATLCV